MKVKVTGLGEIEVKELTLKQRTKLTGMRASTYDLESGHLIGENLGDFMVKVFELSGIKDEDFEKIPEVEKIVAINDIVNAWYPNEKK